MILVNASKSKPIGIKITKIYVIAKIGPNFIIMSSIINVQGYLSAVSKH